MVIKPSEKSPAVSALFSELVPQYLDSDLVRVVNGGVPECTKVGSVASCQGFIYKVAFSFSPCVGITVRYSSFSTVDIYIQQSA